MRHSKVGWYIETTAWVSPIRSLFSYPSRIQRRIRSKPTLLLPKCKRSRTTYSEPNVPPSDIHRAWRKFDGGKHDRPGNPQTATGKTTTKGT